MTEMVVLKTFAIIFGFFIGLLFGYITEMVVVCLMNKYDDEEEDDYDDSDY